MARQAGLLEIMVEWRPIELFIISGQPIKLACSIVLFVVDHISQAAHVEYVLEVSWLLGNITSGLFEVLELFSISCCKSVAKVNFVHVT